MKYIVRATSKWQADNLEAMDLKKVPEVNEQWEVEEDRMKQLISAGLVEVVKEASEKATAPKKQPTKKNAK